MNNLLSVQKQYLASQEAIGNHVYSVAYDPVTVGTLGGTSTPEADALALGYTEYYREDTPRLVEVIYIA